MRYKKGQSGNPSGRPRGTKNKFTVDLKDAFLKAFEKSGGVEGLTDWVNRNPRNRGMFYQTITKMLPSNILMDVDGDLTLTIKRKITKEKPKE